MQILRKIFQNLCINEDIITCIYSGPGPKVTYSKQRYSHRTCSGNKKNFNLKPYTIIIKLLNKIQKTTIEIISEGGRARVCAAGTLSKFEYMSGMSHIAIPPRINKTWKPFKREKETDGAKMREKSTEEN